MDQGTCHTLRDQSCRDLSSGVPEAEVFYTSPPFLAPVLLLFPHNAENINTALSVHTPSQDIYDRAIMACDQVLQHFPSAPARDAPVPSP